MKAIPEGIYGVLLAAGSGSRFGGDKLLHPAADGVAIGVAAARNLLASVPRVIAVVRPADAALASLLEGAGCSVRYCADAQRGMGASLAHGIAASSEAAGWIVALADMPFIKSATIGEVAAALRGGGGLAAPVYQGKRGHPVGFGREFRDELLLLDGDVGARDLIKRHAHAMIKISCDDPGILRDIDRRDDLDATRL